MSDTLRFNVYVKVKEGRLEDFKQIAKDWSAHHLTARPDILSYEWFFMDEDQTQAQVMEIYESSEAMMATLKDVEESGEHTEDTDYPYEMVKTEICGKVSPELRKMMGSGKSAVEYYSHIDGFTR